MFNTVDVEGRLSTRSTPKMLAHFATRGDAAEAGQFNLEGNK